MGKNSEFVLTNNPIKIIFKYKNNNRRTQYQVYIFVGPYAEPIAKTLNKFKDLNFFDTLIQLSMKDIKELDDMYGDKWFYKFFTSFFSLCSSE